MRKGTIGFGIVRSIDPTRGRARLAELCEAIGTDAGTIFLPHHAESYGKLVHSFDSGEVSLAWLPPIASSHLVDRGSATVLALPVRRGAVSYRSALVAKPGGAHSLPALRGKRVAWVDPESSSGYLVPRLLLQAAGLALAGLFAEERFLMSHAAVVDAVTSGRSDVGATYCSVENPPQGPWSNKKPPLEVLTTSGTIPNDAIVVSTTLPGEVRTHILRWFMDLRAPNAKRLCTDLFGADSFRVAADAHFEPLRRILLAARARGTVPPHT